MSATPAPNPRPDRAPRTSARLAGAGRAALGQLAAWLCLAGAAQATGEDWARLQPAQQAALAPLRAQWEQIDAARRDKWLEVAARFPSMPAAEQARVQARMGEWARMSPVQRGQTRLQFQQAQRWTAQERQERWDAYQTLHPQAREVLAERWKLEAAPAVPAAAQNKRNLVEAPPAARTPPRTANPTSVRAPDGATTQPITRPGAEPRHHQPGLPKIVATPAFVDPATLLPRRGPQGAAVARPPPARAEP